MFWASTLNHYMPCGYLLPSRADPHSVACPRTHKFGVLYGPIAYVDDFAACDGLEITLGSQCQVRN